MASIRDLDAQLNVLTIGRGSGANSPVPVGDSQPSIVSKKAARAAAKSSSKTATKSKTAGAAVSKGARAKDASGAVQEGLPEGDAGGLPEITAYSQQSRFHRETFDANTTDVDIKGVNISIGAKDILQDAHLRLKAGVKYGMVGQNGVGKSILMSVLSSNSLIGLPQNVKFLHIAQLEDFQKGRSILQEVVESDAERWEAVREVRALQAVLAGSNKRAASAGLPDALRTTVHGLLVARSSVEVEAARKIATKRSGQRGYIARQHLLSLEHAHAELVARDPLVYVTKDVLDQYIRDVGKRWEAVFGEQIPVAGVEHALDEAVKEMEGRATSVLIGVGFKESEIANEGDGVKTFDALSGGWKMRVVLAKALYLRPDVLLLDEPTNHLDLPAILWLTHHLTSDSASAMTNPDQTVVIVSHDRDFLSRVTTETIIFKDKKLTYYKGNYEDWEKTVGEGKRRMERLKELDDKRKKQLQSVIQKNVQMARSTGDDKRLGMVASRKKALERMGMQRLEDGKRYKRSYHGYRADIVVEEGFKTMPITIPEPYEVPFHSSAILQLGEVSFAYPPPAGSRAKTGKQVLNSVSLDISPHARIALLGPNGCGKSTLMNLLAGVLKPSSGEVRKHHRLRVGYFSQHTVSQLDLALTPLEALRTAYSSLNVLDESGGTVTITEQQARAHFAMVGITGGGTGASAIVHQPIKNLSGGQRNRVALGLVTFHQPHVLLLDEITNHLDVGSVESIVEALRAFEGAVVVVSHDVWFLKEVVEGGEDEDDEVAPGNEEGGEAEKGVFYVVNPKSVPGGLTRWEKGLDAYVERERRRAEKLAKEQEKVG